MALRQHFGKLLPNWCSRPSVVFFVMFYLMFLAAIKHYGLFEDINYRLSFPIETLLRNSLVPVEHSESLKVFVYDDQTATALGKTELDGRDWGDLICHFGGVGAKKIIVFAGLKRKFLEQDGIRLRECIEKYQDRIFIAVNFQPSRFHENFYDSGYIETKLGGVRDLIDPKTQAYRNMFLNGPRSE